MEQNSIKWRKKTQKRVLWLSQKESRNKIEWWKYIDRNKYMVDFLNFLNFAVFLFWTEGLLDQMSRKQKKNNGNVFGISS